MLEPDGLLSQNADKGGAVGHDLFVCVCSVVCVCALCVMCVVETGSASQSECFDKGRSVGVAVDSCVLCVGSKSVCRLLKQSKQADCVPSRHLPSIHTW